MKHNIYYKKIEYLKINFIVDFVKTRNLLKSSYFSFKSSKKPLEYKASTISVTDATEFLNLVFCRVLSVISIICSAPEAGA